MWKSLEFSKILPENGEILLAKSDEIHQAAENILAETVRKAAAAFAATMGNQSAE